MSASPDTGNLADVLRQLVALAEDHSAGEAPPASEGNQPEGSEGTASEPERVEAANPKFRISP